MRDEWTLADGAPPESVETYDEEGVGTAPPAWRTVLTARDPIHVGGGDTVGSDSPRGRMLAQLRSDGKPLIPGSSWKGVFRHRTALILSVCMDEALGLRVVDLLYGAPDRGRGLLWFEDSLLEVSQMLTRTHVAIDRFTGGARDSALYTVEAIPEGATLTLAIGYAGGQMPASVQGLLRVVLKDMNDGLIGVGGHAGRGYGSLEVAADELARAAVDVEGLRALADAHEEEDS